jgi:hypothetical protein
MYEEDFSIKILDDDYNLVSLVSYSALEWDREFNSVGKFIIEGVGGNFDREAWKYVYTEKRKELGKISQVNWKSENGIKTLTISGFFVEDELNKMICYAKPTDFDDDAGTRSGTSILSKGSPTWVTAEGTADQVAKAFFDGFKQISFRNYEVGDFSGAGGLVTKTFELPIEFGVIEPGEYHYSIHNRNNEYLGDKLYDILKESHASIEVVFDYIKRTKTLNIIHGIDRTQDGHADDINPILFTSKNGTIRRASIVTSDADTKDAMIQTSEDETKTIVLANALPDSNGRFYHEAVRSNESDFPNDDKGFKLSVMADASTNLNGRKDKINVQFDFVLGSYKYMEDFDLGDIISIEVPEVGISADAQIVSCHEIIKDGVWNLEIEVGTPILRKRGNY